MFICMKGGGSFLCLCEMAEQMVVKNTGLCGGLSCVRVCCQNYCVILHEYAEHVVITEAECVLVCLGGHSAAGTVHP